MVSVRLLVLLALAAIAVSGNSNGVCSCKQCTECTCDQPGTSILTTKAPVSSDACTCVVPKSGFFDIVNEKYDRAWWQKKQDELKAAAGPKASADLLLLGTAPKDNGCSLATRAPTRELPSNRMHYQYIVILVSLDGKVMNITMPGDIIEREKTFTPAVLKCNSKGQWTYEDIPLLLGGVINTIK